VSNGLNYNVVELLERAFPEMNRDNLLELVRIARQNTYPENTVLCQEGRLETVFYVLLSGTAVITKHLSDDEEYVLRHCYPGDFFGEMAIIQDAPRSATVRTVEESTVMELDKDIFMLALQQNPTIALAMIRTTFDRIRSNDTMTINELREAYGTLEQLDRAKLEFIEVTAHELRTPLTVMRGYASILMADPTIRENGMLQEITQGVVNGTQRLHEIVNNMLDVQRIDMDQVKIAAVPVSIPVVLRGLEMEFREAFTQRHLSFHMELEKDADVQFIEADPALVNKALYHMLMNAIKYTPDGGTIVISLSYENDANLGRVAHIRIADSGIGINAEHHKLIFEKFYRLGDVQLHSSGKTAFKAGGPGLGLALARGAVTVHGGKIWVESPGHDEAAMPGSTFHVVLPVKAVRK
jgi:signal transduction histidine kinase